MQLLCVGMTALSLSEALNYLRSTTVQECTWNMLLLPDTAPPRHTGTVRMTTGVLYMLKAPCIYVKVTNTHEEEEESPHMQTASTL